MSVEVDYYARVNINYLMCNLAIAFVTINIL